MCPKTGKKSYFIPLVLEEEKRKLCGQNFAFFRGDPRKQNFFLGGKAFPPLSIFQPNHSPMGRLMDTCQTATLEPSFANEPPSLLSFSFSPPPKKRSFPEATSSPSWLDAASPSSPPPPSWSTGEQSAGDQTNRLGRLTNADEVGEHNLFRRRQQPEKVGGEGLFVSITAAERDLAHSIPPKARKRKRKCHKIECLLSLFLLSNRCGKQFWELV